ncbi:MAG: LytTR family DNA-binding domain-containing protein, partial [Bacteroidota bacterium]
ENLREGKTEPPQRLALPLIDGLEIIAPGEIRYCEAADNFTRFFLEDGRKLLICRKLKHYDSLLAPLGFCRIHRSSLVNLKRVRRYHRGKGGSVTLDDGTELLVAAARKQDLLAALAT